MSWQLSHCMNMIDCSFIFLKYVDNITLSESVIYYYRPNDNSVSRTFQKNRVNNAVLLIEQLSNEVNTKNLEKSFSKFVVNRVAKCCFDYYGDSRCELSKEDRILELAKLCTIDRFHKAILGASYIKLAPGKKDSIRYAILLYYLRNNDYKKAIDFSIKH